MTVTQGRRIYSDNDGNFYADAGLQTAVGDFWDLLPGDYWRWAHGWAGICPNGLTANLLGHTVVEHDDATVTVSPSILVTYDGADGKKEWHGFLEHGKWKD